MPEKIKSIVGKKITTEGPEGTLEYQLMPEPEIYLNGAPARIAQLEPGDEVRIAGHTPQGSHKVFAKRDEQAVAAAKRDSQMGPQKVEVGPKKLQEPKRAEELKEAKKESESADTLPSAAGTPSSEKKGKK